MGTIIIIALCSLLLLAYVFDLSSALTKIPSVLLLLLLGWISRQVIFYFGIELPDLNPFLPTLGTIGLILIVLEGSLELELNQSKISMIRKASINAILPLILLSLGLALLLNLFFDVPYRSALINVIPFCVISSAIAIPSSRELSGPDREFVTYESSLSDIFGVLLFNFVTLNDNIEAATFVHFSLEVVLIIVISFVSVLGLSFLLGRIQHHVTYTPIILSVILIYAVSKHFHLPGLLFILVFGLFLGNMDELKHMKWIKKLRPEKLDKEIKKFKEITMEATFLIRALFFLLFGFLMKANDILDLNTFPMTIGVVSLIMVLRFVILKFTKLELAPLLYVAPRGLITILLFLSIPEEYKIPMIGTSLIIQTIVLSIVIMSVGIVSSKKSPVG